MDFESVKKSDCNYAVHDFSHLQTGLIMLILR